MAYNYSGFGRDSGPSVPAKHVPSFGRISRAPSPSFLSLSPAPAPSSRVREAVETTRSPPLAFGNSGPTARPYQAFSEERPEASQRVLSPPSSFNNPHPSGGPYPSVGVRRPIEPPQRLDDGKRTFFRDYDAQTHLRPSAVTSFIPSGDFGTNTTAKNARSPELKRTRSPPLLSGDEFSRNSHQSTISRPALSSSMRNDNAKMVGNYPNSQTQQDQFRDSPHANSYLNERSFMEQLADVRGPKRTRSPPITSFNGVSWESPQFVSDSKRANAVFTTNSQGPQRPVPSSNDAGAAATKTNISSAPKRARSPPLPSTGEGLQDNTNFTQSDSEREIQAKAKRLARFKVELSDNVVGSDVAHPRFSTYRLEQAVAEKQKFVDGNSIESARDYPNDNTLPDYVDSEACVIVGLCPDMCPESERGERERKGDLDQYERLDGDRNQTSKYLAVKKYNRTAEREANLIRPMPILQKTVGYLLDLLDQPYDKSFLGLYNFLWDRMRAVRMDLRMQHIFNQEAIAMLEQMIRLHIIAMHELCEYTKGEGFTEGFDAHLNIEQMNKTSVELFQMYDDHRKKGMNIPTEKEFRGYYALLKLDKHPGYKVEPAELSLDLAKMTPEIRQTPEVLFARDVARACRTGNFIAFFRLARKASYLQACLMHAHFAKLRTQALASLHSGLQNNQGLPVTHVGRWLGMEEEDTGSLLEYHGFWIKEFEEPYMVKEGPFLNSDKDYPTKCSKLVLSKRSEKIVEDVSASSQVTSVPAEATKVIQLDKTYKPEIKAIHSVGAKVSVPVVDEEMSDPVAISSPKYSMAMGPIIETSMVDQQCQDDNQATAASIFPWCFSVAHTSPKSLPDKVMTEEKQNGDALFRISSEKKMFVSPESSPRQHMARMAVLERSPSSKRYDYSVQSSPIELVSRMAVPERSPSSKRYDYSVESSPRQLAARTAVPERSPSSKRYDYSVENSLPQSVGTNNFAYEEPQDTQEENENNDVMEDEKVEVTADHLQEEVALARLKLILRLWRRRTLKQKELREQRQLAANAALSSLSLGPPIRHNNNHPSTYDEFDIDLIMRERSERHKRSWSRLNVSDVIAGILGRRNSKAKCLCWKMVVCSLKDSSEMDKRISHSAAEQWLFSKLMPSEKNDDDVVISSPGLSIWKKYVPSQSDTDLTCCFSIVKETNFNHLTDTVSGASAILFLASEIIPWKLQKVQLHNLLMSIPLGSCLPLLILSCSYNKEALDPCAVIINELGLNEIDKSRINSFLVKFLIGNQQGGDFDGFFSDEQLREGLQWLASESPVQPVVYHVKTRELILTHLSSALEVLGKLSDYEVSPNHCISAFSDALDQSLGEIVAAAKTNPSNWPCPEIALVVGSGDENCPTLGWSSVARIQPLECALRELKLPAFPNDISFLSRGSKMSKEIENQRLQLENCLISYLTQSSEMMGVPMARQEASIMLQRSTRLELHNLSYYIVPKWVMIFRRVFNWRLMILNNGVLSSSYVLEQHFISHTSRDLDNLGLEDRVPSPCSLSHPSLDEMMEVGFISNQSRDEIVEGGCSPLSVQRAQSQPQVYQYPPAVATNNLVDDIQDCANTNNSMEYERNSSEKSKLNVANDISCTTSKLYCTTSEIAVSRTLTKEADNLSKLFEQCNLVQNTNEKKLCFYF